MNQYDFRPATEQIFDIYFFDFGEKTAILGLHFLQPSKVDGGHFVETLVEWPIELAQAFNGGRIDVRMIATLRLAETVWT